MATKLPLLLRKNIRDNWEAKHAGIFNLYIHHCRDHQATQRYLGTDVDIRRKFRRYLLQSGCRSLPPRQAIRVSIITPK